ncbi:TetR/AcrR family transcriptional regulator [Mycobacterium heckeshornense]|uniref:TetR/AcrR family transcriptional regulator n=1 Tax=Mycobacterium heckeshornense TaxID=110505 RepID=UPI0026C6579C|nr:TetR/AcrR family transcriptional regulator [Mycobacterium heckeshornense]
MEPETASPGRPRDPQKDRDVLAATRELLVEVGYQRTTIAAVARRAGVGAPTIYRRWPRREALIEDAAFGHTQPAPLPAATGNLYADLRAWVEAFLAQLADPVTRAAIPGLLVAYHRDETLYERLVSRSEEDVRAQLVELLAADGLQQRADAVFDLLVASTAIRALTVGLREAEKFCDRTAEALTALAYSSWQLDPGPGARRRSAARGGRPTVGRSSAEEPA